MPFNKIVCFKIIQKIRWSNKTPPNFFLLDIFGYYQQFIVALQAHQLLHLPRSYLHCLYQCEAIHKLYG